VQVRKFWVGHVCRGSYDNYSEKRPTRDGLAPSGNWNL
jgi:hypothetical protein